MKSASRDDTRYAEIERLLALAHDMLDDGREQIVRDYLSHAIGALDELRHSQRADDRPTISE